MEKIRGRVRKFGDNLDTDIIAPGTTLQFPVEEMKKYAFAPIHPEYYKTVIKGDIIVAGNNIYPEDVEDAVGRVEGVLPGRVIAFGIEDEKSGTEQIGVVAETPLAGEVALKALRLAIVQACMGIDVTVSRVYLAPPRWLIKSSAGKPARSANRDRATRELTCR